MFDASGLSDRSSVPAPAPGPSAVDVSYLLRNAGFSLADLAAAQVCPLIHEYRATLCVAPSTVAVVQHSEDSLHSLCAPVFSFEAADSPPRLHAYEEDDGDDCGPLSTALAAEDDSDDAMIDHAPRCSTARSVHRESVTASAPHKFQWAAVFGEALDTSATEGRTSGEESGSADALQFDVGAAGTTAASSFQFFDMSARQRGNDWAGARHWKLALRARPKPIEEASVAVAASRKKKQPKEKKALAFTADPIDEALFAVPVGRTNPTVMTVAAVKISTAKGEQRAYDLPKDARAEPKDLCRLFLRPRMIAMPAMLASMLQPRRGESAARGECLGEEDLLWGEQRAPGRRGGEGGFALSASDMEEEEARSANYVYEDDDDNYPGLGGASGDENASPFADSPPTGLEIRLDGMVKAARKVEKIDIGCAPTATRVTRYRDNRRLCCSVGMRRNPSGLTLGSSREIFGASSTPLCQSFLKLQARRSMRQMRAAACRSEESLRTSTESSSRRRSPSPSTLFVFCIWRTRRYPIIYHAFLSRVFTLYA